jgi:hypothetical protein
VTGGSFGVNNERRNKITHTGALDGNTYKNMTRRKNNSEFSLSRYAGGMKEREETWSFGVEK